MSLKNDIINKKNASMKSIMIGHFLDSLFKKELEDKEERYGLHASAIIASDNEFCYREQVLSLFFKRNIGKELSTDLLKIFAAGTSIHKKWQNLFKKCGIAVTIEKTRFDKRYDLCFTPDATINYNGEEIPVEIKSMNTFAFQKANSHPSGEKQLNFYLYLLKKKWGFVLAEDKNTQKNKIFIVKYDKEKVKPYVLRLKMIQKMKKEFIDNKIIPPKKCKSCDCKRAIECGMRDACFNIGAGRIKLNKKQMENPYAE